MKLNRRQIRKLILDELLNEQATTKKGPAFNAYQALRKAGNEFGKLQDNEYYSTLADILLTLYEIEADETNDKELLKFIKPKLDEMAEGVNEPNA
tara:strand:+ start:326 stop:610 length:285 start_codon:yes stop_codon:yes gene_type:complete